MSTTHGSGGAKSGGTKSGGGMASANGVRSSSGAMSAVRVIEAKRDGRELDDDEIDWFVDTYTRGVVPPEQMSALAMAVYFRGMTDREIARWTAAMVASGNRMDFVDLTRAGTRVPTVDKHSTGGVGDAVTLILTPLLATWDVAVPQLSGRGLGHTGGTLDKLEAIPGWRADLSASEMRGILSKTGAVICAAGIDLAPADRALYALRDVTGTVPSIPLIASSIMSKKIAEGTGSLVLDVKCGPGAFMTQQADAAELARVMVEIGAAAEVRTSALVTAMHTPLGRAVGNALEVTECLDVLAGGGPADMVDLTCALAAELLASVGIHDDPRQRLADGRAMDSYRAMISAQGGDPDAPLPVARQTEELRAPDAGIVEWDALSVGRASWLAGAGRTAPGESVDPAAGVLLRRVEGDEVREGEVLATVHADDAGRFPGAVEELASALRVTAPGAGHGRGPAGGVLDRLRGW